MAADEKNFAHSMTDNDKLLAEIAQIIVGAHNGSYKSHLIPKEKEVAPLTTDGSTARKDILLYLPILRTLNIRKF